MSAIRPISVADPVAVTTIVALPRVTCVFWKTRLVRSPSNVSATQHARPFLRDRRALTGQRRLLQLQACGAHDPAVCWDEVAGLEKCDITRHDRRRFDLLESPVAANPGMRKLQLRERVDACLGLELLNRAHHHVERHQGQDEDAGRNLSDDEARHRDQHQHDVHRVGKLSPRHHPEARGWLLGQLVASVQAESPLDLASVKPLLRINAQLGCDLLGRPAVPRGLGRALRDSCHRDLLRVFSAAELTPPAWISRLGLRARLSWWLQGRLQLLRVLIG